MCCVYCCESSFQDPSLGVGVEFPFFTFSDFGWGLGVWVKVTGLGQRLGFRLGIKLIG